MSDSRRSFLAKVGALATAPVLSAYVPDEQTGLAVPDRHIEIAREVPPSVVISAQMGGFPIEPHETMGSMFGGRGHAYAHRGDGLISFYVDGERWAVPAFKLPHPGQGQTRP